MQEADKMIAISPQLCKLLLEITKATDVEIAFNKILREYIDLKLKHLEEISKSFKEKWQMSFEEFKEKMKENYSYEVEKDFWEWEEAETLKQYYTKIKNSWI